jgi:exportin-2 (importin alpha re-exporter)
VNIGVLEVAHSIFVRWRPLMGTAALYTEINHVINTFGTPFFQLLAVRALPAEFFLSFLLLILLS